MLGHHANMYIGTHIDILFDIIKTIVSFHNPVPIKPVLYRRVYSNGYHNDPEYIPLCTIGTAHTLTLTQQENIYENRRLKRVS